MNSSTSNHHPHQDSSATTHRYPQDDMRRLISSAHSALEQQPAPSLREILNAYKAGGDGDRDMLIAMLNAKTAEDQRQASLVSLQRTLLEVYQHTPPPSEPMRSSSRTSSHYHYPTPGYTQPPRPSEQLPSRRLHHRHRVTSGSRSPPPSRMHSHMPPRDVPMSHHSEHPRKRHRSSHSPRISHAGLYESSHPSEQFPPSPYSSSERSNSAEYSPRSRGSMTIGSLLSSGPSREMNGDIPIQERD